MKRKVHCMFFILTCMAMLPACASPYPSHYSAEAVEAKVIDADTKKPIDGVIVTANWQLLGGMEGSLPLAQMQVMETQTGLDGIFRFTAWGPLKRPQGYLREDDPQLLLFKSGYEYRRLSNFLNKNPKEATVRRSVWNGKTIELKPFKGTTEEYARHLSSLNSSIYSLLITRDCEWKKIPLLIVAVHKQALFFYEEQIRSSLNRIQHLPNDDEKCGSLKEFFKEYLP